jgi:hypothetical protein
LNIQFGSGVLFGSPLTTSGNTPTNPTPVRWGIIQEATVDFKADLKKLYGQNQFPVATARGKFDVTLKAKLALFDLIMYNQLYFAQTQTSGYNLVVDGEPQTVTANVATVSHIPIVTDWGVQYNNGQTFIKVASGPLAGQYSGPNLTTGVYTFNSADNTQIVKISYQYFVNVGATISIANQLMGYAPEVAMLLYAKFRNKFLAVQLNDVTLGQVSIPTKLEDFWIVDVDGSANADASGNIGAISLDLV